MNPEAIPKDRVYIQNLTAETVIGVYGWERNIKQKIELDVVMAADTKKAAQSDDISDALDYSAIATALTQLIEVSSYQLIESLAEALAQHVLENYAVSWLKLTLRKPSAVANATTVGVEIERFKHG